MYAIKKLTKYSLILSIVLSTTPVIASVCFTWVGFKVYAYSQKSEDFNNDGIIDEYEIGDKHSTVSLSQDGEAYINTYEIYERWALKSEYDFGSQDGIPTYLASFDANNDGFKDIAVAMGSRIVIRINNQKGEFTHTEQYISLSDLYGIEESLIPDSKINYGAKLAVLDINRDGYDDLVIVHADGISIFLNDASGKLYLHKNISIADFPRDDIRLVFVSDLDRDLLPEIVISAAGSYVIYFSDDKSVDVVTISNQFDTLVPSDIDSDGDLDLKEMDVQGAIFCTGYKAPALMALWINNGDGTFTNSATLQLDTDANNNDETNLFNKSVEPVPINEEPSTGSLSFQFILVFLMLLCKKSQSYVSTKRFS